jgi:beta-glucanase (GH16 family)
VEKSFAGWHTLVMQVEQGQVKYYVDGELMATHGDKYYPRVPMSINYNLWFIQGGLAAAGDVRQYVEQIDWLYFAADTVLSPEDVEAKVAGMRKSSTPFLDTVVLPEPLPAICNM